MKIKELIEMPKVNGDGICYCGEPCTCTHYNQAISDVGNKEITKEQLLAACGMEVLDEQKVYELIVSNYDTNDSDTILNCAGTLARIICSKFARPVDKN